jgi:hypothetical protein
MKASQRLPTRIIAARDASRLALLGSLAARRGRTHRRPASQPSPDWHATVRELAAKNFKNPAWGYSHCERDYALARALAAADHVALDDDVLFAAAYSARHGGLRALGKTEGRPLGRGRAHRRRRIARHRVSDREDRRGPRGDPHAHVLPQSGRQVPRLCICTMPTRSIGWARSGSRGSWRSSTRNGGDPDGPSKPSKCSRKTLRKFRVACSRPAGRALVPARVAELRRFLSGKRRESDDLATL